MIQIKMLSLNHYLKYVVALQLFLNIYVLYLTNTTSFFSTNIKLSHISVTQANHLGKYLSLGSCLAEQSKYRNINKHVMDIIRSCAARG